MKGILFAISSSVGTEHFYLEADERRSVEAQIDEALAGMGYCDAYEILSWKEAPGGYVRRHRKLVEKYDEKIEELLTVGKYSTVETIIKEVGEA